MKAKRTEKKARSYYFSILQGNVLRVKKLARINVDLVCSHHFSVANLCTSKSNGLLLFSTATNRKNTKSRMPPNKSYAANILLLFFLLLGCDELGTQVYYRRANLRIVHQERELDEKSQKRGRKLERKWVDI